MPTKFGRFLAGNRFPKLFLFLYIVLVTISAAATANAVGLLFAWKRLRVSIYISFAAVAVLVIWQKNYQSRPVRKLICFLRSTAIYYSIWFVLFAGLSVMPFVPDRIGAICVLLALPAAVLTVTVGYRNTKIVQTKRYDLTVNDGGQPYRIALISDLHMGDFVRSGHIKKMITSIKKASPDLLVVSGDLFDIGHNILDEKDELRKISGLFRKLKIPNGIYAVLGNHDPDVNDPRMKRFLKESRIHLLDNETVDLSRITLLGRTDESCGHRTPWDEIHVAAAGKPVVVLDHRPQGIDEASQHGAALVLSGHTHQGQFFPITYLTKKANGAPYFYGMNRIRSTYGITTSGAGFFGLPMRLGTRNEVVNIHLIL